MLPSANCLAEREILKLRAVCIPVEREVPKIGWPRIAQGPVKIVA